MRVLLTPLNIPVKVNAACLCASVCAWSSGAVSFASCQENNLLPMWWTKGKNQAHMHGHTFLTPCMQSVCVAAFVHHCPWFTHWCVYESLKMLRCHLCGARLSLDLCTSVLLSLCFSVYGDMMNVCMRVCSMRGCVCVFPMLTKWNQG